MDYKLSQGYPSLAKFRQVLQKQNWTETGRNQTKTDRNGIFSSIYIYH